MVSGRMLCWYRIFGIFARHKAALHRNGQELKFVSNRFNGRSGLLNAKFFVLTKNVYQEKQTFKINLFKSKKM